MGETRYPNGTAGLQQPEGVETEVVRIGKQLDAIVSQLHGSNWEMASRGQMYNACSQAATTTTIALAATSTGLCLSNPAASGVNLEVHKVGIALSVAPAAEATISLAGGYAAAGVTTHTTPLTVYNNKIGVIATAASGLADAAATLVGTPIDIMPLIGAGAAAAEVPVPGYFHIDGAVVVPPGAYVFIETLTVVIGWFGIWWTESPE